MPELPEVESIRRSLGPRIVGARVLGVELRRRDIVVAPGDPFGGFSRQRGRARASARPRPVRRSDLFLNATVTALERHGKQLAILARRDGSPETIALVVQLGMSGQLLHTADQAPPPGPHVHIVWRLDNGRLLFRDPRRFGAVRVFRSVADLAEHWGTLGPDALTIAGERLSEAFRGSTRAVKAALLDQQAVAGVGNIYADEALFAAGIRPARPCRSLQPAEIEALAAHVRAVLGAAVEAGGSTLRDYVDAEGRAGAYQAAHAVYGRSGLPCTRCGTALRASRLAQRTTVWCPRCQR